MNNRSILFLVLIAGLYSCHKGHEGPLAARGRIEGTWRVKGRNAINRTTYDSAANTYTNLDTAIAIDTVLTIVRTGDDSWHAYATGLNNNLVYADMGATFSGSMAALKGDYIEFLNKPVNSAMVFGNTHKLRYYYNRDSIAFYSSVYTSFFYSVEVGGRRL